MAVDTKALPPFAQVWEAAIREYEDKTGVDLDDPREPHPRDVDEMLKMLKTQHEEFTNDTRSQKFTKCLQGAVGPFNFLTSMSCNLIHDVNVPPKAFGL